MRSCRPTLACVRLILEITGLKKGCALYSCATHNPGNTVGLFRNSAKQGQLGRGAGGNLLIGAVVGGKAWLYARVPRYILSAGKLSHTHTHKATLLANRS